ncbi:hypothetical protein C499_06775 [Halogeometricum borinquense DSM 11551]|uniref:DUF2249 domain-containing protein n=3 Tax=Halogeometricum borinquense TaxID=60847 RepID=L9UWJ3_HALBP|nr:DUF2249 domain-containing protein [Halogeometricum borinquense]ELY29121.1 hypothetical protein C499_06775 [Halogeometricum borinquense DSM 11551]RYJ08146.1 DUF2249 domain-containing protein [Halogeometricum borinquense]
MSSEMPERETRELDVREIEGEPFGEIVAALDTLCEHETLVLVNSFEPVPLYDVLEQRGFTYKTSQEGSEEWHVRITHA